MNRKERREPVTLAAVRETFLDGDFEACEALCRTLQLPDPAEAVELTLLHARSLIPLNRGDQAIELLRGLRLAEERPGERLTAQMLLGAAYVSLGQIDHGIEVLRAAHAATGDAHAALRAELAVNLAQAHYRKGQYLHAQELLATVPHDAEFVHARALECGGWVAWARRDFGAALERFGAALRSLDACRQYDRFVEVKALYGLTFLCGELPRLELWPEIERRAAGFDWSLDGVAGWRYWLAIEASFATELLGQLDESAEWAAQAESVAPSPSCLIVAWCRLAARFGRYHETGAQRYFVRKARRTYDELARHAVLLDERSAPLALAEELANGATPDDAAALLTYHVEANAPLMRGHVDEPYFEASRQLVEGHLDEYRGNRARAEEAYLKAFTTYRAIGFLRRAAIVAYRLAVLTDDRSYRDFIAAALPGASDTYWVKARLTRARTETRLSERHLGVLRLVAQGLSNKQIAAARGVSFYTARNTVRELLALLGVRTRAELAGVAIARGVAVRRAPEN